MSKNLAPKKESEAKLPTDLRAVLISSPKAMALWTSLTPIARRDFKSWIVSAKLPETRKRRVESMPSRLLSGKRRPCCYAIVPTNLYRALGANKQAKAQWSTLTPDERRDFVAWIDSVEGSPMRGLRIEKVCAMLAAGKRKP